VALAIEEIEPVIATQRKTHIIHFNFGSLHSVHASQVNNQFVVQINKDIIISSELENLLSLIRETPMNLKAVSVVVSCTVITEIPIIPTQAIKREEEIVLVII